MLLYTTIVDHVGVNPGQLAEMLTWDCDTARKRRALLSNEAARLGRSLSLLLNYGVIGSSINPDNAYERARYAARLAALRLDW